MKDAKTVYAQSSSISSRTYLEYRRDMKQKAIAELEMLIWLKNKFKEQDKKIIVEKFGGDRDVWFLRNGGVTGDADYIVKYPDGKTEFIEFQYAKKEMKNYDFKISKITPKKKNNDNTKILYLIKPTAKFAFIEPEWIVKNSVRAAAAAWGNAPVYRVGKEVFDKLMKEDETLAEVCDIIDKKTKILDFQHNAINASKNQLSYLLQQVVDENKIVKIMPKTLEGFFEVCFILNHIDKFPENANMWLVYLLSYADEELNSYELFQLIYCLDFLYPKIELKENELKTVVKNIQQILERIKSFSKNDGSYQSDKTLPPLEDTRYCLFCINIMEDLIQDLLFYYGNDVGLKPIQRIYENLKDLDKTYSFIIS